MAERVLIIGPGAIGGAAAGGFVAAGHDVAIAARTPFTELRVTYPDGQVVAAADCRGEPDPTLDPSAVVLAVKAHQTPAAAPWIEAGTARGAPLSVLQNGVEQVETASPHVAAGAAVVPTVVNLPAHRRAGNPTEWQVRNAAVGRFLITSLIRLGEPQG